MRFCLRVDDFGWVANSVPDRKLSLAQKMHATFQGLPYLGAVIPSTLDHDGLAWLQSAPAGVTIAMHGFNHSYSEDGCASEFRNCDLQRCRQRIGWGKNSLKDVAIRHFVLPFNAYAPDLSEACYLEGMGYIWGGGGHDYTHPSPWPTPPQPYSLGRTVFVPSWAPTYAACLWRMGSEDVPLCESLPRLLELPGRAVITLHITWEAAHCADFRGVRWLVERIGDRVITPEEYLR